VIVLSPRTDDPTFAMEYDTSTHPPLFAGVVGDAWEGSGAAVSAGERRAMGRMMVTDQDA
jgi:hypothetical protein